MVYLYHVVHDEEGKSGLHSPPLDAKAILRLYRHFEMAFTLHFSRYPDIKASVTPMPVGEDGVVVELGSNLPEPTVDSALEALLWDLNHELRGARFVVKAKIARY